MTNPSETKLVERGVKMLTEEHLAKAICLYNGIALQGPDGSEQWWPFCSDAKRMLANADGELESALASLADELRLAREAREACVAAIAYDAAIQASANDPEKMSSFCTAEGEDLDTLYAAWIDKAHAALKEPR